MKSTQIDAAAALLAEHRLSRKPLDALPAAMRPADEAEAYAVQDALHARLVASLGAVSGHKIGCTTSVMQAFLKIPNPCAGGVFARTVHASPAIVPHDGFVRVGVECEIVARLVAPLPARSAPYTRDEVAEAVGAVMAGMEIVDARYVDYTRLDTPTLIADDFFDAGCVLGPEVTGVRDIDLAAIAGVTWINGVEAGRGRGGDVMGHPFEALAWLANKRSQRGLGIAAGEFVFLGSVVETKWVAAGDHVVMEIDRLGRIDARFPGPLT
jgi:2-keto-4-pentenoate hydratase